MLLAGSLEWKDLSAEGAGGDGGWDVCVCVEKEVEVCVEKEVEVKTEEERTPPAQQGPAGRRPLWQRLPPTDPLLAHWQGDSASASYSKGYNEIRGFSSLSLCFSDTSHSNLPWYLQEPLCSKLESMGWETGHLEPEASRQGPARVFLTSPHAIPLAPQKVQRELGVRWFTGSKLLSYRVVELGFAVRLL